MSEATTQNDPVRIVLNTKNLRLPEIGTAELLVWLTRHDGEALSAQDRVRLNACATRALKGEPKPFDRAIVVESIVMKQARLLQMRMEHGDTVTGGENCHWFIERFKREVEATGMRLVQPAKV